MKLMTRITMTASVFLLLLTSCSDRISKSPDLKELSNEVVIQWNEIAFNAFGGPAYQHSLMASRINAMMHLAMHDAINGANPVYKTFAFTGQDSKADAIAAAASAAHSVLVNEIADKKNFLDSALSQSLSFVSDGDAKIRGIQLGKLAGQAILNARVNDGAAADPFGVIPPSSVAGVYQAVPPFNIVFAPNWENVKLFGLQTKDQFRSAPHPALNSDSYAVAFEEVKEKGKLNSPTRTTAQTAYAKFWYEFSEASWNRVARTIATNKQLNLAESARLFALMDMALADAYIAGWDAKFHYNFWRPYTAVRQAGTDGNNATTADASWEPAETTPPVQDYPSTHSALGNAAATVLARIFGDQTPFTMTSFTAVPQGSARSFASFSEAANENADSRVMAGIHFRFSCVAGQELGTKIGNWVVDHQLKSLK